MVGAELARHTMKLKKAPDGRLFLVLPASGRHYRQRLRRYLPTATVSSTRLCASLPEFSRPLLSVP